MASKRAEDLNKKLGELFLEAVEAGTTGNTEQLAKVLDKAQEAVEGKSH